MGTVVFQYCLENSGKTEDELNGFTISATQRSNGMLHYSITADKERLAEKDVSPEKLVPYTPATPAADEVIPEEAKNIIPAAT